jgi:hypothetical protein
MTCRPVASRNHKSTRRRATGFIKLLRHLFTLDPGARLLFDPGRRLSSSPRPPDGWFIAWRLLADQLHDTWAIAQLVDCLTQSYPAALRVIPESKRGPFMTYQQFDSGLCHLSAFHRFDKRVPQRMEVLKRARDTYLSPEPSKALDTYHDRFRSGPPSSNPLMRNGPRSASRL